MKCMYETFTVKVNVKIVTIEYHEQNTRGGLDLAYDCWRSEWQLYRKREGNDGDSQEGTDRVKE